MSIAPTDVVRKGMSLCMPITGKPVPIGWAFALKSLEPPINYNTYMHVVVGKPVDEARNECVQWSLEQKVKYLFFLDEDVVVPPNALKRLIFFLENHPYIDVIGGVYCSKSDPPAPLLFKDVSASGSYWDWKIGEVFKIGSMGMGCTMIRMSIFDKLEKPYFLTIKADAHIDGVSKTESWTEDLYFCDKVNKAGGQVWVDTSIQCEHHDVSNGNVYRLPWNSKPAARYYSKGKKKILDLGCGEIGTIMKDGIPVRYDLREDVNPDYRGDVRALPFKSESYDVVFSSHTLEHFSRKQIPDILDEWLRVLRTGGELRLAVPDLEVAAKQILSGEVDKDGMNVLYGEQLYPYDFHRTGFTMSSLRALLESKGLKITKMWQDPPFSILVEAVKQSGIKTVGEGQGRACLTSELALEDQKKQLAESKGTKPSKGRAKRK